MKSAVVLLAIVGIAFAKNGEHGGGQSGGQSGEHGARNCSIVPSTTTSCSGVTGTSCTDSTNLRVNYFCYCKLCHSLFYLKGTKNIHQFNCKNIKFFIYSDFNTWNK